jgi:glyoxylase-like metal-dependent hydrolase (beta-lactamase superfamily II)
MINPKLIPLLFGLPLAALPQQNFDQIQIHVEPVQRNIYLLARSGGNITVQVGNEGVLMVDSGFEQLVPKVMAEIRKLSNGPIRYIINTHMHPDHVGGNAAIWRMSPHDPALPIKIIAHENVLNRLTAAPQAQRISEEGWPVDEYATPQKTLHFNNEAIIIYHEPNAHTDGDSLVLFRGSDVISTGDIFVTNSYPVIDLANGGSINGTIQALNNILDLAIPEFRLEGGTMIVPGHGRLSDSADVAYYRDMVTIVRDRIQDMLKRDMTLDQVKAARPTRDYDPRYGATSGFWTTDAFVEAVYRSLAGEKKK